MMTTAAVVLPAEKKTPRSRAPKKTDVVQVTDNRLPTIQGEAAAMISMIERAAKDPAVDIEKMERLMVMLQGMKAQQAEQSFFTALSEMQSELPIVAERGVIKNKSGAKQSTYALWEDINEAITPVLKQYGFALSFRTNCSAGILVTGVLSHRDGHSITTDVLLPADNTGNKNTVQAVASSISYGKRYTAGALLNLTSRGEDDDGNLGSLSDDGRRQDAQEQSTFTVAEFNEKFPAWAEKIRNGNDPERTIQFIESKGRKLNDEQKAAIRNVQKGK